MLNIPWYTTSGPARTLLDLHLPLHQIKTYKKKKRRHISGLLFKPSQHCPASRFPASGKKDSQAGRQKRDIQTWRQTYRQTQDCSLSICRQRAGSLWGTAAGGEIGSGTAVWAEESLSLWAVMSSYCQPDLQPGPSRANGTAVYLGIS